MKRQVLVALTFALALGLGTSSVFSQTPPNTTQLQPAPDIPGVIKGGTMPEVVIKGLTSADDPFWLPNVGIVFSEPRANRIVRLDESDQPVTLVGNLHGPLGMTFDEKNGRLISLQTEPGSLNTTFSRLVRTRLISLGLVAALGFLLMASLLVSAALAAFGDELNTILPFGSSILSAVNLIISFVLISVLFAAIYKFVPDRPSGWPDVILGAVVTTVLFTVGKSLIAMYIGRTSTVSSYGAAGALIALLLWVYYSAQIFLLGAEFTKACSNSRSRGNGPRHTGPNPTAQRQP